MSTSHSKAKGSQLSAYHGLSLRQGVLKQHIAQSRHTLTIYIRTVMTPTGLVLGTGSVT